MCTVKNLKVKVDRGTKCKLYFYRELLQSMLGFKVVLDWRVSGQILEAIQVWIKKVDICNSLDPVESQYLDLIPMTYLRSTLNFQVSANAFDTKHVTV